MQGHKLQRPRTRTWPEGHIPPCPRCQRVSICKNYRCRTEKYAADEAGKHPSCPGQTGHFHHTARHGQLPLCSTSCSGSRSGAAGSLQGERRRTPPEDSFIYAPAECTTALFFWMSESSSHSVRGSTFRIVSSFTFFPRGSRLLGWRQQLLHPAVPWRHVSSGPCIC